MWVEPSYTALVAIGGGTPWSHFRGLWDARLFGFHERRVLLIPKHLQKKKIATVSQYDRTSIRNE